MKDEIETADAIEVQERGLGASKRFVVFGFDRVVKTVVVVGEGLTLADTYTFADGDHVVESTIAEVGWTVGEGGKLSPPSPVFQPLTRLQFFSGLVSLGLTKAALMAKLAEVYTDPIEFERTRIFVEENQSFERGHPMVSALGPLFGVTTEQIDAAWLAAAAV